MTKCDYCGKEIMDEAILIVARPNIDFYAKTLGHFCSKCGVKLIEEYRKEGQWIIERC